MEDKSHMAQEGSRLELYKVDKADRKEGPEQLLPVRQAGLWQLLAEP